MIKADIQTAEHFIEKKFSRADPILHHNLKYKINNIHQIMSSIYEKYRTTKTKDEITNMIKSTLVNIRFNDGRGYFFIFDLKGTNILHPTKPEREGKNFFNLQDINGTYIVQESINIAKSENKEGFQTWFFHKPDNTKKEFEKTGFIKRFEPYNWYLGTGEYIGDIEEKIKEDLLDDFSILKYKDGRYIFIIDYNGDVLVKDNKKLYPNTTFKTKRLETLEKFILSTDKNKLVEYEVKRPDKNNYLKISYLKKIAKLKFVIGTGFNLDHADIFIKNRTEQLKKEYENELKTILFTIGLITLIFLLISFLISGYLEKLLKKYRNNLFKKNHMLEKAQEQAIMGSWEQKKDNDTLTWSKETYRIFEHNIDSKITFKSFFNRVHPEDREMVLDSFQKSVEQHTSYYFKHRLLFEDGRIKYVIERAEHQYDDKNNHIHTLGTVQDITQIEQQKQQQLKYEKELQKTTKKLYEQETQKVENYEQTITSLITLIEQRDFYTAGHSFRVADYAIKIAMKLDINSHDIFMLKQIGLLHDIGKIAIPDSILLKPGRLTQQEYSIIQSHVIVGYDIVSKIPMFKKFANIILSHHERYDGSGYPNNLKGDEIPLLASILAIADAFDAMTTTRIYNHQKSVEEALKEVKKHSGTFFNPKIVNIAIDALKEVDVQTHRSQAPKTEIEKERFSYFFKDALTTLYNERYLRLIVEQDKLKYECVNLVLLHNVAAYNKKFGWEKGNLILIEVSNMLKKQYPSKELFRYHGVNFVIINETHLNIDLSEINKKLEEYFITCEIKHIDSRDFEDTEGLLYKLNDIS